MEEIFSTYQSIEVIHQAQKSYGLPELDLLICDEAHRTTGVKLVGDADESDFVKVHDHDYIKAKRRLYMTATPRIYAEKQKTKAKEADVTVWSMDDEKTFGKVFHRLGFGEAVEKGLLSDYRVVVFGVLDNQLDEFFQQAIQKNGVLNLGDAAKILGCYNALSKNIKSDDAKAFLAADEGPMKRVVMFAGSIKASQALTSDFPKVIDLANDQNKRNNKKIDPNPLVCQTRHVDGAMSVMRRNETLEWLKEDTSAQGNVCRIVSNARCLSEGVDVPSLDAIIFASQKNSIIDIVQSVGRVMRKAEGKKIGYVIIPIIVSAGVDPQKALEDSKSYGIVWEVVRALRAHDDRFDAEFTRSQLNKKRPERFFAVNEWDHDREQTASQLLLNFPPQEYRDAFYGRLVSVGVPSLSAFFGEWVKSAAMIAEKHIERLQTLVREEGKHHAAFEEFLQELRTTLNPSISQKDAINMLAQHLLTKPIFDALFENYTFAQENPISQSMQKMLDVLDENFFASSYGPLAAFYRDLRNRVKGIESSEDRQNVIKTLYENFFSQVFSKDAERLGIVYTPVPVVDFILRSADYASRQEFGKGLTAEGVNVLEPFAGTGTFITRLLQLGLIQKQDLERKYHHEIFANEILLLAYYIAAINIEETWHRVRQDTTNKAYEAFPGIVLTDTFMLNEKNATVPLEGFFQKNNARIQRQSEAGITVIIGNPPYRAAQKSANDANPNLKYGSLDQRIRETYAAKSTGQLKAQLYDSYVRAIRWASDRIKDQGLVCFITNGSLLDGRTLDGLRKSFVEEFATIYLLNLRGNINISASRDYNRKEGENIFGNKSRAGVAITILVKNPEQKQQGQVFYYDIGDALTQRQKFDRLKELGSFEKIPWTTIIPNAAGDWINQRNDGFQQLLPLGLPEKKSAKATVSTVFDIYSRGVQTGRDAWVYNFSQLSLESNVGRTISFLNQQKQVFFDTHGSDTKKDLRALIETFITYSPKDIKWTRGLKVDVSSSCEEGYDAEALIYSSYRPFCKQLLYSSRVLNEEVSLMPKIFPDGESKNFGIFISGPGSREFSVLICNALPSMDCIEKGQCFPFYVYEEDKNKEQGLLHGGKEGRTRRENISDATVKLFQTTYKANKGASISKEDIFYYVYGLLHSQTYREKFQSDLTKMLPRVPYAADFWGFAEAGRKLANLHLNYETIEPWPVKEEISGDRQAENFYHVDKMTFGRKDKEKDLTTIIYNPHIILREIPIQAYAYKVNSKSPIDWVMAMYRVKTDEESGIVNDPNLWAKEHNQPDYILQLLKRVIRVSMETQAIIDSLPPLELE